MKTVYAIVLISISLVNSSVGNSLSSWNDGDAKKRIIDFVQKVTDKDAESYVPPAERIAVFDNDGTLWCEQPAYFQLLFALDRVKALASENPAWKTKMPFKAVLENDMHALLISGEKGLMKLISATHSGMTPDEMKALAKEWLKDTNHPRFQRPFGELVYHPMLELLDYLRANDFIVYICSGGGVDFIRGISEETYGVPEELVIGSRTKLKYDPETNKVLKQPALLHINDKAGKPVGIQAVIGTRPIMAVGNSDGDLQMLEYTSGNDKPTLGMIIRHDDKAREYVYDRDSHIGKLDKALDRAKEANWVVVSMKDDFRTVFPLLNKKN